MRLALALVAVYFCVGFAPPAAHARLVRSLAIDSDIKSADATVLGTVTGMRVVQKRVAGPFHSQVEIQALTIRVATSFSGPRRGAVLTLNHPRVLPSSKPMINGFGPAIVKPGETYLLFLKRQQSGHYELITVESSLLAIAKPALRRITKRRVKGAPIDRLVTALTHVIATCTDKCGPAIWLLDSSPAMSRRLRSKRARSRYARSLLRLTQATKNYNSRIAAFTKLGRLGDKSALGRIIAIATARPTGSKAALSNTVSFLQGYDEPTQVRALKTIIVRAPDPGVVKEAKRRLQYLNSRARP